MAPSTANPDILGSYNNNPSISNSPAAAFVSALPLRRATRRTFVASPQRPSRRPHRRVHHGARPAPARALVPPTASSASASDSDATTATTATTSTAAEAAAPPPVDTVTFSVGHSRNPTLTDALHDAARRAAPSLARHGRPASIVLFFLHSTFETHPKDESRRVVPTLRKTLAMLQLLTPDTVFVGCTTAPSSTPDTDPVATVALVHIPSPPPAPATAGGQEDKGEETSTEAAAAAAAGEQVVQHAVRTVRLPDDGAALDWGLNDWHSRIGLPPQAAASPAAMFVLRAPDAPAPATSALLAGLDFAYPRLRKLGAEAGRTSPLHEARLYDADGVVPDGEAVALVVSSPHVAFDVLVAQAARPVGPMLEVVEVRGGAEVAKAREVGTPAAATAPPMVLLDMWGSMDAIQREEVEAAKKYLLLGTEVASVADMAALALGDLRQAVAKGKKDDDSKKDDGDSATGAENEQQQPQAEAAPESVDMLTRKVVGFNLASGSLAVEGEAVSLGSRAQFQIRDAEAARSELDAALQRLRLEAGSRASDGLGLMGAVAFVDVERGDALYGKGLVDLDRTMFQERFGVPVATLTSGRQIGPLPAGGLRGDPGRSYSLAASAVFVAVYGRIGDGVQVDDDGRIITDENNENDVADAAPEA